MGRGSDPARSSLTSSKPGVIPNKATVGTMPGGRNNPASWSNIDSRRSAMTFDTRVDRAAQHRACQSNAPARSCAASQPASRTSTSATPAGSTSPSSSPSLAGAGCASTSTSFGQSWLLCARPPSVPRRILRAVQDSQSPSPVDATGLGAHLLVPTRLDNAAIVGLADPRGLRNDRPWSPVSSRSRNGTTCSATPRSPMPSSTASSTTPTSSS